MERIRPHKKPGDFLYHKDDELVIQKKKLGNPRQECWSLFHLVVSQGDPFQVLSNFRDQLNVYFFMDIIILMSWCIRMARNDLIFRDTDVSCTKFSE
jgi:hypothetical protein